MPSPPIRITLAQAREAWLRGQRLVAPAGAARPAASPAAAGSALTAVVADVGWIPMPSPATPYLALLARGALTTRAALDDAVCKRGELVVVPGPRGASWLVPAADAQVARAFAVADHASREARVAAATTLTARDLEGARDALRTALEQPRTADELRAQLPERFLRSLGDPGRKCGLPTVASLVLRSMWVTGEVTRIAAEGRLDRGAVQWAIDPRPRTVPTAAEAVVAIAERWLAAHGPISARAFAAAFGIAAGRANAALKGARLVEVEVEGQPGGPLLAPEGWTPPVPSSGGGDGSAAVTAWLLPVRDPLTDVQLESLAPPAVARAALTRSHGVGPCVLVHGEVVGAWVYDEVAQVITWRALGAGAPELPPAVTDAITTAAQRTALFIARELAGAPLHTAQGARSRPPPPPAAEVAIELQ